MMYFFMFLMGALAGGIGLGILLYVKLRSVSVQKQDLEKFQEKVKRQARDLGSRESEVEDKAREIERLHVSYPELLQENTMLKRDLQNVDVNLRKLELDRDAQARRQEEIDARVEDLGGRYLKDNVSWIGKSLTTNNFVKCKQRLLGVIDRCRNVGFEVSEGEQDELIADLKREFEKIVRAAAEKEEQARIKAQIREQQKLEREIERELKQAEREREAVQAALERALSEAEDDHSQEVETLRARLAEAEERMERTKSRAEMTKAGHVYVISNVGSFGEDVYKIGMTRRLDPEDRVRELSSASVPFPFDIHMMISCDDAPKLENALHRSLRSERINKVNLRKEFFRADLDRIRSIVEENHGEVEYIADVEALEYLQSMEMTADDEAYLETVFAESDDEDLGSEA